MTLRKNLSRTRQSVFGRVSTLLGATEIDNATWDGLEALLIQSDMGVETTLTLVGALRQRVKTDGLTQQEGLSAALREELLALLVTHSPESLSAQRPMSVLLVIGANGSGKTTTIAKLAHRYHSDGRKVIVAAADTFRAAAIEQLQKWGQTIGVPVIVGQQGSDPGAVVYDAVEAAKARGYDLLIIDTAGRLHTNTNLVAELQKIAKVAGKGADGAPHEVWMVLDGTTGQNALAQASHFKEAVGVTGAILTKLDSTAKGGMLFSIEHQLELPVRYIGIGEGLDDLIAFDGPAFVDGLLEE